MLCPFPVLYFRALMLTGFLLFLLMPTVLLISRNRNLNTEEGAQKADQLAVRLARSLAWLFGVRVEVKGTPVSGAVLFTANHISWLDIPVVHSACAMGFVGKAEIEQWPIFSYHRPCRRHDFPSARQPRFSRRCHAWPWSSVCVKGGP